MLETERLLLRRWRASDAEPFAALSADPIVMEHFSAPLDRAASDAFVDRIEATFDERGYGLWAVEVRGGPSFIGFVGLWPALFTAHFTPAVEVGWRLAADKWGNGYAPEGARASLAFAFEVAAITEVVSMTTTGNLKSRRVMEKIGIPTTQPTTPTTRTSRTGATCSTASARHKACDAKRDYSVRLRRGVEGSHAAGTKL